MNEDRYISPKSALPDGNGDELSWRDAATETAISLLVGERIHPVERFEMWQGQLRRIKAVASADIFTAQRKDSETMHTLRRVLGTEVLLFQAERGDFYWSGARQDAQKAIEDIGARHGFPVRLLDADERSKVLESLLSGVEIPELRTTSLRPLVRPVKLTERTVWVNKHFALPTRVSVLELLKFKFEYESKNGFDAEARTYAADELFRMLFDIFTLRGKKMLDVHFDETAMWLHLRERVDDTRPTEDVVQELTTELHSVMTAIEAL